MPRSPRPSRPRGRSFFSVYNAGRAERGSGAPFMRGTVLVSAPAQRAASFSRLEITGSRVLCEQVDGRGIAFDRFTLRQ